MTASADHRVWRAGMSCITFAAAAVREVPRPSFRETTLAKLEAVGFVAPPDLAYHRYTGADHGTTTDFHRSPPLRGRPPRAENRGGQP